MAYEWFLQSSQPQLVKRFGPRYMRAHLLGALYQSRLQRAVILIVFFLVRVSVSL